MASEADARTPERQDALTGSHQAEREALCTALVIGATLIAGPATAAGKAAIHHTWLTAKTKIALAADGRVKGWQIDVGTTQGAVMLRGKVDSDSAKHAAAEIAKMLDGVKTMKNDLEVVALSKRDAVEDKYEAVTARAKEHFAKDAHLKKTEIAVQTNAGVVSLTGEVKDITTSAHASWTAWFVPGVKSVKNDLTVKEKP